MGRILYLMSSYPRWSEEFIRRDLSGLLERGLPVVAASLFPGDCQVQPGWPIVKCLSSGEGDACPVVRSGGGRAFMPRNVRLWFSLFKHRSLLKQVEELCREECITHLHGEFADLAGLLATRAAGRLGLTYSLGVHADDCLNLKYPPSSLFGRAEFITVCNESACRIMRETWHVPENRLHLVHHGVDLSFWKYSRHRAHGNGVNMIFAGRLVPKKGLDILLQVLAGLPRSFTLSIAGNGPEEDRLRLMASELGIAGRVNWLGRLGRSALRYSFGVSSCLCVPSCDGCGGMDGIPNIVLEAMASGLPVVAFDSGGIGEVVNDDTGWLVRQGDVRKLEQVLLDFSGSALEIERRCANGRKVIENDFDSGLVSRRRADLFSPFV